MTPPFRSGSTRAWPSCSATTSSWCPRAAGQLDADASEAAALVLGAQGAGGGALSAGPTGREVDAAARALIDEAGHGERFGHGLGHGVGMEVHEGPRLTRTADEPLR